MTIVSISRKKICDAIEKEPTTLLQAGTWVGGPERKVRSKDCTVCAVGAVMRNALLHPNQSNDYIQDASEAAVAGGCYSSSSNVKKQLKKGLYMAALSAFFEKEWAAREIDDMWGGDKATENLRKSTVKQLKKDVIEFVKENFPKYLQIDIDGAKPAKDLKIIESNDQD